MQVKIHDPFSKIESNALFFNFLSVEVLPKPSLGKVDDQDHYNDATPIGVSIKVINLVYVYMLARLDM